MAKKPKAVSMAGVEPGKGAAKKRSSTRKGDDFETRMYAFFSAEVKRGAMGVNAAWSKVFRKKGYYSRDRGKVIVFDVSIEVTRPGESDPMLIFIIECKDYGTSIPVDDVEEFHSKLGQVAGVNVKGIIASTTAFQQSARSFAASKKMGVVRIFADASFKWVLQRSPAASIAPGLGSNIATISKALSINDFEAKVFDFFAEAGGLLTNSPWDFMVALATQGSGENEVEHALASRPRSLTRVAFVEREYIESVADAALVSIGYRGGAVALETLCEMESTRSGLTVSRVERAGDVPKTVLACITFEPPVISLFPQDVEYTARARFTLAHELGHHQLGHGKYMRREFCEAEDFEQEDTGQLDVSDMARLEWQANQYASCLLMPKSAFVAAFRKHLVASEIPDRGFGAFYLDDQPCNNQAFFVVASKLMLEFGVSKTAVRLRLMQLGLLVDERARNDPALAPGFLLGSRRAPVALGP
jgi:hypothetical protein